ncbi:MAG TPA: hypothetical protein VFW98_02830 [Gemmatimonadaceae bacterium]|nr:hypothetical protein [Gemmatimonadaceae bacterium]
MWARFEQRVHPAFGTSRPERVTRAVVRAIRSERVEVLVNPMPVRPAIASWALAPGMAARMFRLLGIDAFMLRVARGAHGDGASSADERLPENSSMRL